MTTKDVLNAFISTEICIDNLYRECRRNYKKRTPFEMFNDEIKRFYGYTGNNTDFKSLYSFNEFTNLFYDAVCYDEELPEYVQEKFLLYFRVPIKVNFDEDYAHSARDEIKACTVQAKLDNAVKDFWIKHNDRTTKKVRELVFRPHSECDATTLVCPLIKWAENHNRLDYDFILKMFEYGYITGKRDERAKRKERERREK